MKLDLPDGDVELVADFLPPAEADRLFDELHATTAWRQETITFYGRESPVPRLSAWYGDRGAVYTYSHITMQPEPWTPALLAIRTAAEQRAGVTFNAVLCNLYRDGRDSVAWHSDDEDELGSRPLLASVSLGSTRTFQFRHRARHGLRRQIDLHHASLLVMRGETQQHWRHQIPKTARPVGPRINLTFRTVSTE